MPRYKLFLHPETLQKLINQCPLDKEGWVKTSILIKKIQAELDCSIPTAYRTLYDNFGMFDTRHGKIKQIVILETKEPEEAFLSWLDKKNTTLDKIVAFLGTQNPNAKVDDLLVKIGIVREELKSGLEWGLEDIKVRLQQDFKTSLEEILNEQ